MKTVVCICKQCKKEFLKPANEFARCARLGKMVYCSRSCAGARNLSNFGDRICRQPPPPKYQANPFRYYLRNCLKRGHPCDLTLNYLKTVWEEQKGICPYSGVELVLNTHQLRNPDKRFTASLDRIDSNKGYIEGNVQFISMAVNFLKSTMTHQQTIEFLQILAKNWSSLS